jgi:hypothetical protein
LVTKVRERLTVSKQATERVYTEGFSLKKLNEVEDKEHYRVEISNRFLVLANLELRRLLIEHRKLLERIYKFQPKRIELKKHKPWFDEGCTN